MAKDFKNINPATAFLGKIDTKEATAPKTPAKTSKKATTSKKPVAKDNLFININRETKSKRVQLLVKPSLYDKGKRVSENNGISFNDLINHLLENL